MTYHKHKEKSFNYIQKIIVVVLILMLILPIIVTYTIYNRKVKLANEIAIAPEMQANTIWKSASNDIYFIVGDSPNKAGNFDVFVLYNGEYVQADFSCDYARQATLAIPNAEGIVESDSGAIYLVVGTYHISEDEIKIEDFQESSSAAFLKQREEIAIQKYMYHDLINSLPFEYCS